MNPEFFEASLLKCHFGIRARAQLSQRLAGKRFVCRHLAGCALLTFCLLSQNAAFAQEAPQVSNSQEMKSKVRELLQDLEADGLEERDQAEKALIDLGTEILPLLPKVTSRTSGEMKIRLQRIRDSFQSAESEGFFEASMVNLQGTMQLTDALRELSSQTENEIQLQGEDAFSDTEVITEFNDIPFWEAVDSLMAQAKLRINTFATTGNELVLGPGGEVSEDTPVVFQTGPFRVEPTFLQATRQFNSQLPGQLQVSLNVSWEPRLQPVFMSIPMSKVGGETEAGEAVAATNPQAAPEIPLNFGGCTTQIDLQVALPGRDEKKLKNLTGEFVIAVPGESHEYVFKDFANGARQAQKYGDVSVILEGARRNGKVYEMRIRINFGDAQGALESYRGFIQSNKAYLLDNTDKRHDDIGLNTYAMTENSLGIAYLFQINGDPKNYRLVYESPSSVTRQTVRYELEDIPLP